MAFRHWDAVGMGLGIHPVFKPKKNGTQKCNVRRNVYKYSEFFLSYSDAQQLTTPVLGRDATNPTTPPPMLYTVRPCLSDGVSFLTFAGLTRLLD